MGLSSLICVHYLYIKDIICGHALWHSSLSLHLECLIPYCHAHLSECCCSWEGNREWPRRLDPLPPMLETPMDSWAPGFGLIQSLLMCLESEPVTERSLSFFFPPPNKWTLRKKDTMAHILGPHHPHERYRWGSRHLASADSGFAVASTWGVSYQMKDICFLQPGTRASDWICHMHQKGPNKWSVFCCLSQCFNYMEATWETAKQDSNWYPSIECCRHNL